MKNTTVIRKGKHWEKPKVSSFEQKIMTSACFSLNDLQP